MKLPVRRRERASPNTVASPVALSNGELSNHRVRLEIIDTDINKLRLPQRNVRRYGQRQLHALKASVAKWDVIRPILVDGDGTIVAGVAIWMAAKELGHETIPVIRIEHLSPEQIRLYRISDNKLSSLGADDADNLRLELIELSDLSITLNLDLDLELTGLTSKEIDDICLSTPRAAEASDGNGGDGEDDVVPLPGPAVTRAGDIWLVGGDHRIICGNSLEEETYAALLGEERAQMVVCDGPYGVPIRGHVSSRKDAREFEFGCGQETSEEFIAFERTVMSHLVRHSIDGSIHYHWMSWHSLYELLAAGRAEYTEHKNILVWKKTNASRGFYRSQHELCCVFKNGTAPHICTFGIEKGARWRSNVLEYPGCNTFSRDRDEDLADHPTVKNLSCIADLMRDCSRRGGIVLDPFGGVGTTLLAAELTGRRARLIEIDPLYVDVTIRRAARKFGLEAVLASTGQSFDEVALERLGEEAGEALDG
jgi:hypothetical protein